MNQHDQNASAGYPGTDAPQDSEPERESKGGIRGFIDGLFGGTTAEAAENNPDILDQGLNDHVRQDVGLGTADVAQGVYDGSAASDALGMADDRAPGGVAPPDSPLYPLNITDDSASKPAE
jgi:hypothetical protein